MGSPLDGFGCMDRPCMDVESPERGREGGRERGREGGGRERGRDRDRERERLP